MKTVNMTRSEREQLQAHFIRVQRFVSRGKLYMIGLGVAIMNVLGESVFKELLENCGPGEGYKVCIVDEVNERITT